jgi:AAA+ ATPase superfamily predicted ATPase
MGWISGTHSKNSPAFVGRADVLREVLTVLRHHKHNAILLFGQRRIGKTSVLRELEAKLPTQGDFLTIF